MNAKDRKSMDEFEDNINSVAFGGKGLCPNAALKFGNKGIRGPFSTSKPITLWLNVTRLMRMKPPYSISWGSTC